MRISTQTVHGARCTHAYTVGRRDGKTERDGWLIDRKKGRDRDGMRKRQRAWRESGVDKERTETGSMHSPH